MDVGKYFHSLDQEVDALQERVRYLIKDSHWQTDGEWKESVVRQVLRRNLPATAQVSRGFVITPDSASTQIDILIHDASKPVVFRDGDLVFVTPDAVFGLIEVKSSVDTSRFADAVRKLCSNIRLVRLQENSKAFAGLFSFKAEGSFRPLWLKHVADAAPTWDHRLDFAALGKSWFIRFWPEDPEDPKKPYNRWHSYELYGRAMGYFVHNVVDAISPQSVLSNENVWFPSSGKEPHRVRVQRPNWP